MVTKSYRITGIVQGVGFRPFIHRIAEANNLNGWVLNDSKGVLIEVQGKENDINSFLRDIKNKKPIVSKIDDVFEVDITLSGRKYHSFEIRESVQLDENNTFISPDLCVCDECVKEMFDSHNHRYRYAFINCTNCGPRFTIIKEMPYDRRTTTMNEFTMCKQCSEEYSDVKNRRYHAQPNACPECGPKLNIIDSNGTQVQCDDEVEYIIDKLLEGKICAIKSLGGFHLAVNAKDDNSVKRLRKLKKRDFKPFALMMPSIEVVKQYMYVNEEEEMLLKSEKRPIVLLKKKEEAELPLSIAPKNPCFGVMLPSAPLHYLLLSNSDLNVLVMTSGNVAGEPIAYKNDYAYEKLNDIADYFLMNDRDIFLRVDDSIVRSISNEKEGEKYNTIIRRARGYAPRPITVNQELGEIFAFGSELKNTIAFSKKNQVYLSQHIGDVKNDEIFNSLLTCKKHFEEILDIEPQYYACDMHPSFRSTRLVNEQSSVEVVKVQHHHAHMASCMAENNITNETVLGIVFDGTGYGLDGTIWGGEFLVGDYSSFKRVAAIDNCNLIGGDKAVKEPIRVAYDLLLKVYGDGVDDLDLSVLKELSDIEKNVYKKMVKNNINTFPTSSVGRLFDGISSLLGICYEIQYEGQAAIELEAILNRNFDLADYYSFDIEDYEGGYRIIYEKMVRQIVIDIQDGEDVEVVSRRFHSTIIEMSRCMALKIRDLYKINTVV